MRRRAAFYLLLGLVTALLMVALATGVQTRGSADPNDWMQAHRHGAGGDNRRLAVLGLRLGRVRGGASDGIAERLAGDGLEASGRAVHLVLRSALDPAFSAPKRGGGSGR